MTKKPFLLGLTGSIGMGKSTTTRLLAHAGIPCWDADAAVHRLYSPGGDAVGPVGALHPAAVRDGGIDRAILRDWVTTIPGALEQLEAAVHPLVAEDRRAFIAAQSSDIVCLDIPLLFETGASGDFDAVAVVSTSAENQRERVLARPGMTEEIFRKILSKQVPDAEKRARADFVITTDTPESAEADVKAMLAEIRRRIDA